MVLDSLPLRREITSYYAPSYPTPGADRAMTRLPEAALIRRPFLAALCRGIAGVWSLPPVPRLSTSARRRRAERHDLPALRLTALPAVRMASAILPPAPVSVPDGIPLATVASHSRSIPSLSVRSAPVKSSSADSYSPATPIFLRTYPHHRPSGESGRVTDANGRVVHAADDGRRRG